MSKPIVPVVNRPLNAEALWSARTAAGLTQGGLSSLTTSPRSGTPIDLTAISHYERGKWKLTDNRLAYLLGVIQAAGR